jgi:UDP:flavonoid glycosyltransferase YjiC (YdhE family)
MARIAFAWELGGEYGHVMSCSGLAGGLDAHGHRIAFMFRELRQLAMIPEARAYDIFQAPRSMREGEGMDLPAGYADIMLGCGFARPAEAAGMMGAWRSLFRRWQPDLVIADFAPTALLAARSLNLPRVTYGNGFFLPPRTAPLPPFRFDAPVDLARLAQAEAAVLASANAALARFGAAPLARLADLFDGDDDFLCTFPELDHYGTRETSGYWGPRVRFDRGTEVAWPPGTGKRIFVYVKTNLPQLDALLDVLVRSPHRIVAFIPGLDAERRRRLAGRHRIVVDRPVKLERFLRECDLLISHGGEMSAGALTYGVPSLVFPTHYEQFATARRLEQLGAGGWLPPNAQHPQVAHAFTQVTTDPRYAANARTFAQRYPAFSPNEQRRRIVARIEALLRDRGAILPTNPTPTGKPR